MKAKLKKFTSFVSKLLPHEVRYLMHVQQFADDENLSILKNVQKQVEQSQITNTYPLEIDKRKYSRLMDWMEHRLASADIDQAFETLVQLEQRFMTDSINAKEEKLLLQILKETESSDYYFMKRYELAQHFRHFLQIRLRHKEYQLVNQFINKFRPSYEHSRHTYERLQDATVDIINQYSFHDKESRQWEAWLLSVFRDMQLDGLTRYYALVRLIFIYYNYGQYDLMDKLFVELDEMLSRGIFYSRRILINYYGNRLLFHSKTNQLQEAELFGYLSIREKNSDYLHYVNNLGAVLLKQGKVKEAVQLMQSAFSEMKSSPSFHHKVSYATLYVRSLNDSKQYKEAEAYAETFLLAYHTEILRHRWHAFFANYLQALYLQSKFKKLQQVVRKYKLLDKEVRYLDRIQSLAVVSWYYQLSLYKTEHIELDKLKSFVVDFGKHHQANEKLSKNLAELFDELNRTIKECATLISQPI